MPFGSKSIAAAGTDDRDVNRGLARVTHSGKYGRSTRSAITDGIRRRVTASRFSATPRSIVQLPTGVVIEWNIPGTRDRTYQ